MIQNYRDFIDTLNKAGFSMGGGNSEGIYAIINWDWKETPPYNTPVRWHTGDPETDPWEWRMRVLEEHQNIAYSKLFFKKSGYITKAWYPYFLAARRKHQDLANTYLEGKISQEAKRIYELIELYGVLPMHTIKELGGFTKADKSRFDRALTELQMKLYLTMCGHQQKRSKQGEEYGWSSTVFCRTEDFFDKDVFQQASCISKNEAVEKITAQIYCLNSDADTRRINRFILG